METEKGLRIALPLTVLCVPLVVARLDALAPVLGRLLRRIRTPSLTRRARRRRRFGRVVIEAPVPLGVVHGGRHTPCTPRMTARIVHAYGDPMPSSADQPVWLWIISRIRLPLILLFALVA